MLPEGWFLHGLFPSSGILASHSFPVENIAQNPGQKKDKSAPSREAVRVGFCIPYSEEKKQNAYVPVWPDIRPVEGTGCLKYWNKLTDMLGLD